MDSGMAGTWRKHNWHLDEAQGASATHHMGLWAPLIGPYLQCVSGYDTRPAHLQVKTVKRAANGWLPASEDTGHWKDGHILSHALKTFSGLCPFRPGFLPSLR